MALIGNLATNFRNLAKEAEADESRMKAEIGRHRRIETKAEKLQHHAHNTAKHAVHVIALTWMGLPAILAFEAARPLWSKYVETPLSDIMVGNEDIVSTAHEYLSFTLTTVSTFL